MRIRRFLTGAIVPVLFAAACGSAASTVDGYRSVTVSEAKPMVDAAYSQFVDVRTADEFKSGHAPRSRNIPLDTLAANLDLLEKNETVILICRTDNRSRQAAELLHRNGFKDVVVVQGGMNAWTEAGFPIVRDDDEQKK